MHCKLKAVEMEENEGNMRKGHDSLTLFLFVYSICMELETITLSE